MKSMKRFYAAALAMAMTLVFCLQGIPALAGAQSYHSEQEVSITLEVGESRRLDHPNRPRSDAAYFSYAVYNSDDTVVSTEYASTDRSAALITGLKPGKADVTIDLEYAVQRTEYTRKYDVISKKYVTETNIVLDRYIERYRWVVTVIGKVQVTAPTARSLTYSGSAQVLVNAGSAVGGTMQYALGTSAFSAPSSGWSASVPNGTDTGTYNVWYRGVGNDGFKDSDPACVTVTIDRLNVTVTAADQTVQQGGSIDTGVGKASLSGQVGGHKLSAVTLTADDTSQPTSNGRITPSNAKISDAGGNDRTANYNIGYVAGRLTVLATPTPTTAPTPTPTTAPTPTPTTAPTTAPTPTPTTAPTGAPEPVSDKIDIADCKITVKDQYYTGKALRPAVSVKYAGTALEEGVDYAVSYKNNKEIGKGTVIVTGIGRFTGSVKAYFEIIEKIKLSKCKFSVKDQVYTGKALQPDVTVKYGKQTLKKDKDYKLSYKNNKAVGMATVTVKGKGKYTGSKTLTFKISPKGTAFSKLTGGKQQITLKWNSAKGITGYEIEYSRESDYYGSTRVKIKKAKTLTTTIKDLKAKKKYYVLIRTYKTVGEKTYYSAWSKTKTVKTK